MQHRDDKMEQQRWAFCSGLLFLACHDRCSRLKSLREGLLRPTWPMPWRGLRRSRHGRRRLAEIIQTTPMVPRYAQL